ncbi:MgtC/SapB family protein [Flavobacterium sp. LS1R10]|uniref:MgtC/SapB family protein n=1 Tax=Flavobacterium sp. LS1R10 TaxID=2497482 RepID=UPI0013155F6D|nr:MgtC/SapB family protein [Flavobacterium sp. LS1R10]
MVAILGCIIGYQRERKNKNTGIRTFGAVSAGGALFAVVGMHFQKLMIHQGLLLISLQGKGFLGAGIICNKQQSNESNGLTTAANV